VSSAATPRENTGAPRNSSSTVGVGTGMAPCSLFVMPSPVGTAEENTRSTPRSVSAVATPTRSRIVSSPEVSWNRTMSGSRRETRASASA